MKKVITKQKSSLIPVETIERKIFVIRGMKVMIDADIAEFYGVTTGYLNRAVDRNSARFPMDFMFQLTGEEFENLKCQFGIASWGGRRSAPYAFTEHGVMMLSSVLKSNRAVEMGIFIVRTFIKLREVLATHKDLANKFNEMVRVQVRQGSQIESIQKLLLRLTTEAVQPKERIGFRRDE